MDLRSCLQNYAAIVVVTTLFWGETPWVGSAAIALDHPTTHAQVWPDLDNPDAQMIVFADMLLNMDLTADAIALYEQRYTRFIDQGEPDSAALTLLSVGDHFALRGHLKDAIPYYQRVTTITDATLSAWLIRDAQDKIGAAYLALGDFEAARQSYEDRLALERSIESSWAETETLIDLLPRLENGGFWDQTAIAGNACLTSPNPMAEAPATLIFIAAFSSRSFSAEQLGHRQWRVSKSRCSKI